MYVRLHMNKSSEKKIILLHSHSFNRSSTSVKIRFVRLQVIIYYNLSG